MHEMHEHLTTETILPICTHSFYFTVGRRNSPIKEVKNICSQNYTHESTFLQPVMFKIGSKVLNMVAFRTIANSTFHHC